MLAKAKAKAAEVEKLAKEKAAEVEKAAKEVAAAADAKYAISEKAAAGAAVVRAEAAAIDEKHGLSDKAAAAKLAATTKAKELDEKTGASEKAHAARAAAAAKAKEIDASHGISEKAAAAAAAAAAKVNEVDQRLAAKYIAGYVGHTSTLEFKCKEGNVGADEWIAWSQTEDGLPFTKRQKGCILVQCFTTETGIYLFEEWDLPASQHAYLAIREERSKSGEVAAGNPVTDAAEGEPAAEPAADPVDKVLLAIKEKFEAPDVGTLTDAVTWDITGEQTTSEVGFHIVVEINAADEAKYAELLAWSQSEGGLAFTASQKGILSLRSYKKGTSMVLLEQWESAEAQAAYMAVREEQGTLAKMVESGTLNAELPFRAIPLTLVSTYKNEAAKKPEAEPAVGLEVEDNPAAELSPEPASEPEAEENPALGLPPSGEAPVPANH